MVSLFTPPCTLWQDDYVFSAYRPSTEQAEILYGLGPNRDFLLAVSLIIYILLQIYSTLDNKLSARPRQRVKGRQCDCHLP